MGVWFILARFLALAAIAAPAALPKKNAFEALDRYLFSPTSHTDGVVVWKGNQILLERYAHGYGEKSPHLVWSVTKSVSNALIGMAVLDGKMRLTDSICLYFPDVKSEACEVTLDHLLRHASGFSWKESYEGGGSPTESSVLAMLYGEGRGDMGGFLAHHPLEAKPGTLWKYSSGGVNLALSALQKTLGAKAFDEFPWRRLFDPLKMERVTFERDGKGVFVGSSYLYITPRDLVKFGQLFLQDGVWEGKRLLPKNWVKDSLTPTEALKNEPPPGAKRQSAGASWWLNIPVPEGKVDAGWPGSPRDTFAASGHWGQVLFVVPSKGVIAVRVGDDRGDTFSESTFLQHVLEAIP